MRHTKKVERIGVFCNDWVYEHGSCINCPIESLCDKILGNFLYYPKEANEAYEVIDEYFTKETTDDKEDIVNHPSHYTHGGMECIDEMLLIFGKEAVMHFCLLNAWKYRKRALYKNGEKDMEKSNWYIAKYKELANGE